MSLSIKEAVTGLPTHCSDTMDTQQKSQMNMTACQVLIPELAPPEASSRSWNSCKVACIALVGLSIITVSVGMCVFWTQGSMQDIKAENAPEKIKQTFNLQEPNAEKEYDIFTAPRHGLYVLHGQVTLQETLNYQPEVVYLWGVWRSGNPRSIQTRQVSCIQEIIFATECEMDEGFRVYLKFNTGSPNRTATTFNVYEL